MPRRGHYYIVLPKLFSSIEFLGTSYPVLEGTQYVRNDASGVVIIDLYTADLTTSVHLEVFV